MDVEIVEIADGKALELGKHIFPVHKRVMKLDEQLFRPLEYPVMVLGDIEEYPVCFRDLHIRSGSFQIDLQGRQWAVSFPVYPCLQINANPGILQLKIESKK